MDVATIAQLIGSLGFPIVACIALYNMISKNEASHREETKQLSDAVNNNTIAITKLITKLGGED